MVEVLANDSNFARLGEHARAPWLNITTAGCTNEKLLLRKAGAVLPMCGRGPGDFDCKLKRCVLPSHAADRTTERDGARGQSEAQQPAGPDGEWIIPPAPAGETLLTAEIDHHRVLEERQNLDPSGHYSRRLERPV